MITFKLQHKVATFFDAVRIFSYNKLITSAANGAEVRRSSDNGAADIGFDSNGDLDETALLDHVGTTASDNGFISKYYEQHDVSDEALQSSAASQPQIVAAGVVIKLNGRPRAKWDNSFMESATAPDEFFQPNTFIVTGENDGQRLFGTILDGKGANSFRENMHFSNDNGNFSFWAGAFGEGGPTDDDPHVITAIHQSPQSMYFVDELLEIDKTSTGTQRFSPIKIGGFIAGVVTIDAWISEILIYNENKFLTNGTAIRLHRKAYYGL